MEQDRIPLWKMDYTPDLCKWYPLQSPKYQREAVHFIVLGANRQPQAEYPNEEWGYGTMDLYRSLDTLRQL